MKTNRFFLAVIAATLSAAFFPSLAAAPKIQRAMVYRVSAITKSGETIIERGDTHFTVRGHLGSPRQQLGDDVWVYPRFEADLAEANECGCDTVLITFNHGYVTEIMLVNHRAFTVVAAQMKAHPLAPLTAKTLLAAAE